MWHLPGWIIESLLPSFNLLVISLGLVDSERLSFKHSDTWAGVAVVGLAMVEASLQVSQRLGLCCCWLDVMLVEHLAK